MLNISRELDLSEYVTGLLTKDETLDATVFIHNILIFTRLLGCFAPIFCLNCEHVLFVYILKQRRKKFCGFKKKLRIFKNLIFFTKLKTFKTHVFFHKPSLWSRDVPQKFGPDGFSRFDVFWIQTDRESKFIYRLFPAVVS